MEHIDRMRARVEIDIDASLLRDLEHLEEGKYRIDRMGNTIRRCLHTTKALMDNLLTHELGRLEARPRVKGQPAVTHYHMEERLRLPADRRFSTESYSAPRQSSNATRRHTQLFFQPRATFHGEFMNVSDAIGQATVTRLQTSSVDDKIRRIRQQNNRLKNMIINGQTSDYDFLKEQRQGGNEQFVTWKYSTKDEMASRDRQPRSNAGLNQDKPNQSGLSDGWFHSKDKLCRDCSKADADLPADANDSRLGPCTRCGRLVSEPNDRVPVVSGPRKGSVDCIKETKTGNPATVKKSRVDQESLIELVFEQRGVIEKLKKKLEEEKSKDALFRLAKERSAVSCKEKSPSSNFMTPHRDNCETSLKVDGTDNKHQMSPIFGKQNPRPNEVSLENSKGAPKSPDVQNVIHFQDGPSRINPRDNSYESLQDIEQKIHSLNKMREERIAEERVAAERQARASTACTAKEAETSNSQVRQDGSQFVRLKPYSSRERFGCKVGASEHFLSQNKASSSFKRSNENVAGIRNKSSGKEESDVRQTKSVKKPSKKESEKPPDNKKTKPRDKLVNKEVTPKQKEKTNKLFVPLKLKQLSAKGQVARSALTRGPSVDKKGWKTSKVVVSNALVSKQEPRTSSVDRMFKSGALYRGSLLKENGFDSFNNGLIAYCFLKRRFAPEYKKRIDNLVDKIEDFLLVKKVSQAVQEHNKT